jgi:hypothetical protein
MKPQRRPLVKINAKTLYDVIRNHGRVLGGQISWGTTMSNIDPGRNINCFKAFGVTPAVADTDFTVPHSLNRMPLSLGFQDTDNGGVLYRSPAVQWTSTTVTLRCTKASSNYNVGII